MEVQMRGGTLEQFTEKLRSLRRQAIKISPDFNSDIPYDPLGQEFDDDQTREQITLLYERTRVVFERFGVFTGARDVKSLYERNSQDILYVIDEPPWHSGEYLAINTLVELIDHYIFAYSSNETELEQYSLGYLRLRELLRNIESTFIVTKKYPRNESELQEIIESILICSFPRLQQKPSITKPMKNYIPDTGIPEARTLIEYKYITRKDQIKAIVDQILADMSGYKHPDWDRIIYVIYETARFSSEIKWKEQLQEFKHVDAVVVRGTIPTEKTREGFIS